MAPETCPTPISSSCPIASRRPPRRARSKLQSSPGRCEGCPVQPLSAPPKSCEVMQFRLGLLQPKAHVHLVIHPRRGGEVLPRFPRLARAPVELAEAVMATGQERREDLLSEVLRRVRLGRDVSIGGLANRLAALETETRIGRQLCRATNADQAETAATSEAKFRVRRIAPPAARALFPGSGVLARSHSMTSSARPRSDGGIVSPRALAVFRL